MWLSKYSDGLTDTPVNTGLFNDDCLGRSLSALFEADRNSLLTELSCNEKEGSYMKKPQNKFNYIAYLLSIIIVTLAILTFSPSASADEFAQLKGYWQCQEEGVKISLEFKSRQQLLYNGTAFNYQLAPGNIQVQNENGLTNYFFTLEGGGLIIVSQDGSVTQCLKKEKLKSAEVGQKPYKVGNHNSQAKISGQGWPPPYVRPQGNINEDNPSAQMLLYKFAGRWDHVTTNTLTNLFLKPDGTYEEVYESSYSGQLSNDENWNATGAQQEKGHWKVVGSLKQGKLYLMDLNGKETVYQYQVHIKNGEIYWGEYNFNGKFYSVKYIYR